MSAGSGHEHHRFHAFPLLRTSTIIPRLPFVLQSLTASMFMSPVDEALSLLLSFVFLILYLCGAQVTLNWNSPPPFLPLRGL